MRMISRNKAVIGIIALFAIFVAANLFAATTGDEKPVHKKAWLGIYMQDMNEDIAEAFGLDVSDGVLINGVIDDSPADKSGLKEGDLILRFDGRRIDDSGDLTKAIRQKQVGDDVTITILRDDVKKELAVTLGETASAKDKTFSLKKSPKVYTWTKNFSGSISYLGVTLQSLNDQLADYFEVEDGALITEVMEDSPAEKAGLKAGDVILKINDKDISSPSEATKIVRATDEGDNIDIVVSRRGSTMTLVAEIEEREMDDEWFGWNQFDNQYPSVPNLKSLNQFFDQDALDALRNLDLEDFNLEGLNDELESEMDDLRKEIKELHKELQELKKEIR